MKFADSLLGRVYNLKPSRLDPRDWHLSDLLAVEPSAPIAPFVDNRSFRGSPRDQGQIGRCTGYGTTNAVRTIDNRDKYPDKFTGSANFQYYNERLKMGTLGQDSGSDIGTALDVMSQYGLCPCDSNHDWNCNDDADQYNVTPSDASYKDALNHKLLEYYKIPVGDINAVLQAFSNGYVIVAGIVVFRSFESQKTLATGDIPMPGKLFDRPLGGHCLSFDGYDQSINRVFVENSWGAGVGKNGGFTIPFDYLTNSNYTIDLRAVRRVA